MVVLSRVRRSIAPEASDPVRLVKRLAVDSIDSVAGNERRSSLPTRTRLREGQPARVRGRSATLPARRRPFAFRRACRNTDGMPIGSGASLTAGW